MGQCRDAIMPRYFVGPCLQRLDPNRDIAIKLVEAHTAGPELHLKLGKLGIEVVDSPCAVWKADHVWSSVMARSFSYPSLHPNVLAKTVTAQAIRLSAADSIRRRTSWTRPFFSFD